MNIRTETAADRGRIATLIARTYHTQGLHVIEQTSKLRKLPHSNPQLHLVCDDENGEAQQFALFTPVQVGEDAVKVVLLAPLAFDIRAENLDVHGFMERCFAEVSKKGYVGVLMHGDLSQYTALGFKYARDYNISDGLKSKVHLLARALDDEHKMPKGEAKIPAFLA